MLVRITVRQSPTIELWPEESDKSLGQMVELPEAYVDEFQKAQRNFNDACADIRKALPQLDWDDSEAPT